MADVSDSSHGISPENAKQMRQFFGLYGSFLQLWQCFELVIEIGIMRRLNLSARHASIVLNSLNFAAKSSILLALLKEDSEKNGAAISAISEAQNQAQRNDFTHSFLTNSDDGLMRLIRRNVRNGNYRVALRDVNPSNMHRHGDQFAEALRLCHEALAITSEDIDQYAREIESHA